MSNQTNFATDFPAGKATGLITKIQKLARENGSEARIVGGAVRDWLMRRPVKDFDMAINMPITRFINILNKHNIKFYETGIAHGTITVVQDDVSIEVTQTRIDVKSDGRHSEVKETTDWSADANRRDFTVNAIYVTDDGTMYDPYNGALDIQHKKLKFIGCADARIEEDYLRILRAFRFVACLPAFALPKRDIDAIKRHCHNIKTLSAERITDEFSKWLAAENPIAALKLAVKIGLDRHGFGFEFSLDNLKIGKLKQAFLQLDWLARLASITPVSDKNKIVSVMQFSRQQQKRFERLMRGLTEAEAEALATSKWKQTAYWHASDIQDMARIYSIRTGFVFAQNLLDEFDAFEKPKFPISGEDLIQLGWVPGPQLGARLVELERIWVLNDFKIPSDSNFLTKKINNSIN
mgnify:FL=1